MKEEKGKRAVGKPQPVQERPKTPTPSRSSYGRRLAELGGLATCKPKGK